MHEGTNNHYRVLGIVEVIYGTIHAVGFLILGLLSLLGCGGCFAANSAGDAFGVMVTSAAIGGGALVGALIFAFVTIAGLALMNGRRWAKIATIVFGVLSIANFPLGTIFAIYALWTIVSDHRARGY